MIKKILSTLCLLALTQTTSASIIETNGFTTINWSAECSDCQSTKGDTSYLLANPVTGNVVLDGFSLGEDFAFDESNFVSFQYDGPSVHVDQLVIHNANYSESDEWIDQSNILLSQTGYSFWGEIPELNPDAVLGGYTHFGENMEVDGWIKGDLSSYFLDLTFDTYIPIDQLTGQYKALSSFEPGVNAVFALKTFNILFESSGDWSISVNDGVVIAFDDIGRGARVSLPTADVPEPSTLAILGLGLLGLVRLRKKA